MCKYNLYSIVLLTLFITFQGCLENTPGQINNIVNTTIEDQPEETDIIQEDLERRINDNSESDIDEDQNHENQFVYKCFYFFDSAIGNDESGDGTLSKPWKSVNKLYDQKNPDLKSDPTFCFKRGQTFIYMGQHYMKKRINLSGSETKPIIIGAYGDRNLQNPIIRGGIEINKTWEQIDNNTYKTSINNSINSDILYLWVDETLLHKSDTLENLKLNSWFIDSKYLYIQFQTKNLKLNKIIISNGWPILTISAQHDIIISDIDFEFSKYGILGESILWTISDANPNIALASPHSPYNITINNCSFRHVERGIEFVSFLKLNGHDLFEPNNIVISNNIFYNILFASRFVSTAGIIEDDRKFYHVPGDNFNVGFNNIKIINNLISNVDKNAFYVFNAKSFDIEAIGIMNAKDSIIKNNTIFEGLKLTDGIKIDNRPLKSVGIILWNCAECNELKSWDGHNAIVQTSTDENKRVHNITNVTISDNILNNLGIGILFGASRLKLHCDSSIQNNSLINNEIGIKINSGINLTHCQNKRGININTNSFIDNNMALNFFSGGFGYDIYNNTFQQNNNRSIYIQDDFCGFTSFFESNIFSPDLGNYYCYKNSCSNTFQEWLEKSNANHYNACNQLR